MEPPVANARTFRIRERIGRGGFGDVYLAEMVTPGGFAKVVALKFLRDDMADDPSFTSRLRDEARLLGQLRHPAIVQAEDLVRIGGRLAVVMEYVPGANVSWIVRPRYLPDPIPPTVVLGVVRHVADALEAAWTRPSSVTGRPLRVLHRDIKPANIRVTPDGVVKVLDFGVARSELLARESATGEHRVGSLSYMAPELFRDDVPISPATDIYGLGVVLYELAGRRPFGRCGITATEHRAAVRERMAQIDLAHFGMGAEDVAELITQMTAFRATSRPSARDVAELCGDIEHRVIGPRLDQWAREVVPQVVERFGQSSEGPLVGRLLLEDSSGGRHSGLPQDLGASELPTEPPSEGSASSLLPGRRRRERPAWGLLLSLLLALGLGGWWVLAGVRSRGGEAPVVPPRAPAAAPGPVEAGQGGDPRDAAAGPGERAADAAPARGATQPPPGAPGGRGPKAASGGRVERSREGAPVPPAAGGGSPGRRSAGGGAAGQAGGGARPAPAEDGGPATGGAPEDAGPAARGAAPPGAAPPGGAPAGPPAARPVEAAFSSRPLGMKVSIDGEFRGHTPLRLRLAPGPHVVIYEGGGARAEKRIVVESGERNLWTFYAAEGAIR